MNNVHIRFNSTGEMLALSSMDKDCSVKIVHTQSLSVFKNFPGPYKHLGKVGLLDKTKHFSLR